jgi:hypothetical protein
VFGPSACPVLGSFFTNETSKKINTPNQRALGDSFEAVLNKESLSCLTVSEGQNISPSQ